MSYPSNPKVALVYPGDRASRDTMGNENNRFPQIAKALADVGIKAEPSVYHDDFADEVRRHLLAVDAALVWVNPIEGDRDRTILDSILRDVADSGVFVSTHPDVILKLGTKEVLFTTRELEWGSDVHRYLSLEDLRRELPLRLAESGPRVLKQYRGNGGNGVWKVEISKEESQSFSAATLSPDATLRVRHAKRGCFEQEITFAAFMDLCAPYFDGMGRMIDQPYQTRLKDGMLRCYLVHDRVAGFGHQVINALYPPPAGFPSTEAPQPGPRLYYPPDKPEFQHAKVKLETEWLPAVQKILDLSSEQLPVLWDVDLLLGPKDSGGNDTYVLCEINVSSVSPFPDSATPLMAEALARRFQTLK